MQSWSVLSDPEVHANVRSLFNRRDRIPCRRPTRPRSPLSSLPSSPRLKTQQKIRLSLECKIACLFSTETITTLVELFDRILASDEA